ERRPDTPGRSRGADPPLRAGRQQGRHPLRPARTIKQTGERAAPLPARRPPATRPAADRGRRDAEAPSDLSYRQPALARLDERESPRQSELGVTVKLHPGPSSSSESSQTHSLEGGPDVLSAVHNLCRRDS